jgi:hypothetical protein
MVLVPLMGIIIIGIFGTAHTEDERSKQRIPGISWRLLLGIGALPGILLFPFKTSVSPTTTANTSTTANTANTAREATERPDDGNDGTGVNGMNRGRGSNAGNKHSSSGGSSSGNSGAVNIVTRKAKAVGLCKALSTRENWPKLIGCAGGWFLFDITFYGNVLFAPTVLKTVFHSNGGEVGEGNTSFSSSSSLTPSIVMVSNGSSSSGGGMSGGGMSGVSPGYANHSTLTRMTMVDGKTLSTNLSDQLLILALVGLPGYYVSVWLMDRVGRKNIQMQGFAVMSSLYVGERERERERAREREKDRVRERERERQRERDRYRERKILRDIER